jgi:hypothetical protein
MTRTALQNALVGLMLVLAHGIASAAMPSSGTISETTPTLTYTGGPFPVSNPTPSPISSAPTCNAAATCDPFTLTVTLPANYATLHPDHFVSVRIDWESLAGDTLRADLDLWIYKGSSVYASSASINAAEIAYLPAVSGTYTVRVVPYHAQGESYTATVALGPLPPSGIADAIYRSSADVWSKNLHLTGPGHAGDREPAIKFDPDGNAWVSSNGPGIGLWKINDPCGQLTAAFTEPEAPLTTGGGDTDVEIAPEKNALGFYNIYTSSLYALVNFNSSVSTDGGQTFVTTPLSTSNVVDDRQWNAAHGANTVYLSYHSVSGGFNIYVVRSDAGGLPGTFVGPFLVNQDLVFTSTLYNNLGNMVTDRRALPAMSPPNLAGPGGEGNVYHGFVEAGNKVYVGVSHDFGVTWTSRLAHDGGIGANYSHFFTWVAVDEVGNVYTAFSDDHNIYYCFSTDQGQHWSSPRRVSNGAATKTAIFPAMEAGSAGRLVFAWYGAQGRNADDPANQWQVFTARCQNALDLVPVFEQTMASDHIVHTGRVCETGTTCAGDRELLDLFEMHINPIDGSSLIAYTDDGASGGTYIARQLSGSSAIAGKSVTDRSLTCPTNLPCPPVTLLCPADAELQAGELRHLEFEVINAGQAAGRFGYDLRDPLGWTTSSSAPLSGVTPAVAAGESFTLAVDAQAPASCPPGPQIYRWKTQGTGTACAVDSCRTTLTCTQAVAVGEDAGGFDLGPAFPNPFDGSTLLSYRIPARSRVVIEVFTVGGRRVRTLLDEVRNAGPGEARLESRGLASGVYLVRLQAGGRSQIRRVMFLH